MTPQEKIKRDLKQTQEFKAGQDRSDNFLLLAAWVPDLVRACQRYEYVRANELLLRILPALEKVKVEVEKMKGREF
jgi:hypothetical protein